MALFCTLCMAFVHPVNAQVTISVSGTPVPVSAGSIAQVNIIVQNDGAQMTVRLDIQHPLLQELGTPPPTLTLEAGKSFLLPLSFLIPKQLTLAQPLEINIRLSAVSSASGQATTGGRGAALLARKTVFLALRPERKMMAFLEAADVYATDPSTPPRAVLHCRNAGNTQEQLAWRVYPSGQLSKTIASGAFLMLPHEDTALYAPLNNQSSGDAQGTVYVVELSRGSSAKTSDEGATGGNDIVFSGLCHLHTLAKTPSQPWVPPTAWGANQIGLFANYASTGYNFYELTADRTFSGDADRGSGAHNLIRANVDALYYPALHQGDLRSAFLGVESKNFSLDAGSMTRNYDFWMTGRGVSVTLGPTYGGHLDMGYMNSRFDLSAPLYWRDSLSTQTFYAYYMAGHASTALYYQRDPLLQEQKYVGALHWTPLHTASSAVSFALDGSQVSDLYHPDAFRQPYGFLASVQYAGHFSHWGFQTDNLYGSPYYAGLFRGTLQLDDRIDWLPSREADVYARYYENDEQPQYLHPLYNALFATLSQRRAETGISTGNSGYLQVSAGYAYDREQGTGLPNGTTTLASDLGIVSMRLSHQGFYMSNDMSSGWFQTNQSSFRHYLGYKDVLNLSFHGVSLYGTVQQGAFYPGDAVQQSLSNRFYTLYSLAPGVNGYLLHQHLYVRLYDELATGSVYNGWTQNLNAQADYSLQGGFILHGSLARLESNGAYTLSYTQVQGGIIRKFRGGGPDNVGTVRMHLYEDLDHNQMPDKGDMPAGHLLVSLDGVVQMADAKGRLRFRNVSSGRHAIELLNAGEWAVTDDSVWIRRKHAVLYMALHRVSILNGQLAVPPGRDLAGISFRATDLNGKVFRAVCDASGHFTFYLPSGNYAINVQPTTLPDEVICFEPEQWITVLPETSNDIVFKARLKAKKVLLKRFTPQGAVVSSDK